jgi:anhydro-N-acetylmuramic acid kinase
MRLAMLEAGGSAPAGSRHVQAVEAFLGTGAIDRATVDLIGFHGQTVLHLPSRRLTLRIGDGAGLAARLDAK